MPPSPGFCICTVCPCPKNGTLGINWAATCQNQQNECAPSKDSDQPGHLPSLISLRCPHEETWVDRSLRWAHSHFVGFVMSWLQCMTHYVAFLENCKKNAIKISTPLKYSDIFLFIRYSVFVLLRTSRLTVIISLATANSTNYNALRSACPSMQSYRGLRLALYEYPKTQSFFMRTAYTDQLLIFAAQQL